jgi:hypothetical protein
MIRFTVAVLMVCACGPVSSESSSTASDTTSTSSTSGDGSTTIAEVTTSPTTSAADCEFCVEIENLCMSTQLGENLCGRFGAWTCKRFSETACDDLADLCIANDPTCDADTLRPLCEAAHDSCMIETIDEPSSDSESGSGGYGGSSSGAESRTSEY